MPQEELKDGANSKARRKRLLVHVGAHVDRVLARKRAELRARARLEDGERPGADDKDGRDEHRDDAADDVQAAQRLDRGVEVPLAGVVGDDAQLGLALGLGSGGGAEDGVAHGRLSKYVC